MVHKAALTAEVKGGLDAGLSVVELAGQVLGVFLALPAGPGGTERQLGLLELLFPLYQQPGPLPLALLPVAVIVYPAPAHLNITTN